MKFIRAIANALNFLRTSSQLEYYIKSKNPKTHAEVEKLMRDFYNMRSM
jgi:hypothetical protein